MKNFKYKKIKEETMQVLELIWFQLPDDNEYKEYFLFLLQGIKDASAYLTRKDLKVTKFTLKGFIVKYPKIVEDALKNILYMVDLTNLQETKSSLKLYDKKDLVDNVCYLLEKRTKELYRIENLEKRIVSK